MVYSPVVSTRIDEKLFRQIENRKNIDRRKVIENAFKFEIVAFDKGIDGLRQERVRIEDEREEKLKAVCLEFSSRIALIDNMIEDLKLKARKDEEKTEIFKREETVNNVKLQRREKTFLFLSEIPELRELQSDKFTDMTFLSEIMKNIRSKYPQSLELKVTLSDMIRWHEEVAK